MSLVMYYFQSDSAFESSVSPINLFVSIFIEGSGLIISCPHELCVSFYTLSLPWVLIITLPCVSECICICATYFRHSSEVRTGDWVFEATCNAFFLKWTTSRVFIDGTENLISPLRTIEVLLLSRIFEDILETWLLPSCRNHLHLRDFQIQVQLFDFVHVYTLSLLGAITSNGPWWQWLLVESSMVFEAFAIVRFSRVPLCNVLRLFLENLPILSGPLVACWMAT